MDMMWIKKSGIINVQKDAGSGHPLGNVALDFFENSQNDREQLIVLAFFTDHFSSGRGWNAFEQLCATTDDLLEVRIFGESAELWLHRSSVGEPFSWRIASEENVPADSIIESCQILDIDSTYRPEGDPVDEFGARKLRTIVGGYYSLPVRADERYIRIISYLVYDKNGTARAADYRICGFGKEAQAWNS